MSPQCDPDPIQRTIAATIQESIWRCHATQERMHHLNPLTPKCLLGVVFDPATHCLHRSTSSKALSHFGTASTTFLTKHDGYGAFSFLHTPNCTAAFRTKRKAWVSEHVFVVPAAYVGTMESLGEHGLLGKLLAAHSVHFSLFALICQLCPLCSACSALAFRPNASALGVAIYFCNLLLRLSVAKSMWQLLTFLTLCHKKCAAATCFSLAALSKHVWQLFTRLVHCRMCQNSSPRLTL